MCETFDQHCTSRAKGHPGLAPKAQFWTPGSRTICMAVRYYKLLLMATKGELKFKGDGKYFKVWGVGISK